MKRLIAYATLLASTLILIGVQVMGVFGSLQTNLEFTNGREYVYRLSDKDDAETPLEEGAAEAMAAIMRTRLEAAAVTRYNIVTEGNNQVRVTLSEVNETRYNRIQTLLAFDGEFSLCTTRDTCYVGDEMFLDSVARVEYVGQTPNIVIPISNVTQFKDIILKEAETIASEEGSEGNTPQIILWANRTEADTYEASKTDQKVEDKIVLRFSHANVWWENEESEEIKTEISLAKYGTQDPTGLFPLSVVSQANEEANYLVNLFNASPLDYSVEFLFHRAIDASVEPLLIFDRFVTVNLSQTLIALVIALILLGILLVTYYRLVGLTIWFNALVVLFLSLVAYVQIGVQFSSATLFAGFIVLALSLIGAIPFVQTLRQEIYKGRSLKKAAIDANATSLIPQIEITVISILLSLGVYLFGGNLLQNLAVFVMLGSTIALVLNWVGLRWVLGILLADPLINKNLASIGIQPKHVPQASKDEKQTYFGRFASMNFSSKKTLVGWTSLLVVLATLATSITLALVNQPVFTPVSTTIQSRLYIEVAQGANIETLGDVENEILPFIVIDDQPMVYSSLSFHEFIRVEEEVNVDYRMYVVESTVAYTPETLVSFDNGTLVLTNVEFQDLLLELQFTFDNGDDLVTMSVHDVQATLAQPDVTDILAAILIVLLFGFLYTSIRLGLARGFTLTLNAFYGSVISALFFSVLRTSTLTIVGFAGILVPFLMFTLGFFIYDYANRMLQEQKLPTVTLDQEISQVELSTSRLAGTIFVLGVALAITAIAFFALGPSVLATLYAASLLGILLSLLLLTSHLSILLKSILSVTKPWVTRLFAVRPTKISKDKTKTNSYSAAEPVEATYIGIND